MRERFPWLNLVLFVVTFFTTLFAGAIWSGADPITHPWSIINGFPFAGSLMLILLSHELSHYVASKIHHTKATLPYFIPAPTIIGTLGAVIKMKSPIITRRALVDIGASGPLVGFVFSVVFSVIGLAFSGVTAMPDHEDIGLGIGNSILFYSLVKVVIGNVPSGYVVDLHSMAFAGWIGLFVTSLNLIPIGQLDGGHILYAILGEWHRRFSVVLVCILFALGFLWPGWALWGAIMVVIGLRHPPVMYWERPLDPARRAAAFASLFVFVITFTPVPFQVSL